MLNSTSPRASQINLFNPFQEPANWAESYGAEMFDDCCRGYEGISPHEWEPAISVTFFPNEKAQSQRVRSMTLAELRDEIFTKTAKTKKLLPWLKLATFGKQRTDRNCLRHDDNVVEITGVELDYDAKQMTFDKAVEIARKSKLQVLIYTSARYSDAKPKWRLLAPTSQPLPPKQRERLAARINGIYGGVFDPASFTLSQSYYYGAIDRNPAHRVEITDGDFIDLRDDLDAAAIDKSGAPPPASSSEEGEENWAEQYSSQQNYEKPPPEKVIAALQIVVNDVGYVEWIEVGHEIKSWDASDEVGWPIWDDWGATWPGKLEDGQLKTYDRAFAWERWVSFRPTRTNIGALFNRASKISPGWWEQDSNKQEEERQWPVLHPDALYGLTGKVVALFDPHTESDPVALLLQFMVCFGNALDRGPYYLVEGTKHHTNLNALLVGETGKSRKGTSADRIRQLMTGVTPNWVENCIQNGLSSGEGLIWVIRDEVEDDEGKVIHEGVHDKRLLLDERKFSGALTVMKRDGNTVSRFVRDGWDGREHMKSLTKNSPAAVTRAHISIIGHITADELRRMLDGVSMVNGYANRFLFTCVRRSKYLPFGGNLDQSAIDALAQEIKEVVKPWDNANFAERYGAEGRDGTARYVAGTEKRITMDAEARALWERVYRDLSEGQPGLVGAITQRGDAQTTRLALLYAVLDGSEQIRLVHLKAALALWKYCEDSARYIFGDTIGDPLSDELLRALRSSGEMTRTQIRDLFKRNKDSSKIEAALAALKKYGRVQCEMRSPKGRGPKVEVWIAT